MRKEIESIVRSLEKALNTLEKIIVILKDHEGRLKELEKK